MYKPSNAYNSDLLKIMNNKYFLDDKQ
jgi:hypothetical protein